MIVPDKNRDPCSVHCWRTTALRRRIAPFSHDILLSSSHRPCQRESERFSIPPGVKSAHIWRLSSATRSTYLLGYWVREKKVLALEEAVRKLTSMPAAILGLKDRGSIRPGLAADLVVFDPDTVAALPPVVTYDLPA